MEPSGRSAVRDDGEQSDELGMREVVLMDLETKGSEVLAADYQEVEFELVLDSGSVDHICSRADIPGYVVTDSELSRKRPKLHRRQWQGSPERGRISSEPVMSRGVGEHEWCGCHISSGQHCQAANVSESHMRSGHDGDFQEGQSGNTRC